MWSHRTVNFRSDTGVRKWALSPSSPHKFKGTRVEISSSVTITLWKLEKKTCYFFYKINAQKVFSVSIELRYMGKWLSTNKRSCRFLFIERSVI